MNFVYRPRSRTSRVTTSDSQARAGQKQEARPSGRNLQQARMPRLSISTPFACFAVASIFETPLSVDRRLHRLPCDAEPWQYPVSAAPDYRSVRPAGRRAYTVDFVTQRLRPNGTRLFAPDP